MNRRSILGAIAGAPFASKVIAETAIGGAIGANAPPYPPEGYGESQQVVNSAKSLIKPLVDRSSAIQAILCDKQAMAEIRDELFAENRTVHSIDPDIMAMRSFSPMAKITFQRQRNVERAIAEALSYGEDWNKPHRYIRALATRLDKIMWGRSHEDR